MSALFDAIVLTIDDSRPDEFSFSEMEMPVTTWNRLSFNDKKDLERQVPQTETIYTYTWTWHSARLSLVIHTRNPAIYDAASKTYTLHVAHNDLAIKCCDLNVDLPSQGPVVHTITYHEDRRTHPDGVISLVQAIQRGVVDVVA